MVHLLIDFVNRRTPPLVVHDHTSLQPALPQRAETGCSLSAIGIRRIGLFLGKSGGKSLPFDKGGSKIFLRKYVLREHNPKAARAIAAFFVDGDMQGCHVSLLS